MSLTINGTTNTITASSGLTIAGNTAVTGTLSATGNVSGVALHSAHPLAGNQFVAKTSHFGYSPTYTVAQFGLLDGSHAISLGVDVSGNTSAGFNGNEIILPHSKSFIAPNAGNTGFNTVMSVGTDGSLAIGNKLDLSGASAGQIKFPATQNASADANTLDDYEEGTWTPTLTNFTVTGAESHTGKYTKIGRQVTVRAILSAATSLQSSASSYISGLPFSNPDSPGSMATMTDNGGANSASNGYCTGTTIYPGSHGATQYKYVTATYFV